MDKTYWPCSSNQSPFLPIVLNLVPYSLSLSSYAAPPSITKAILYCTVLLTGVYISPPCWYFYRFFLSYYLVKRFWEFAHFTSFFFLLFFPDNISLWPLWPMCCHVVWGFVKKIIGSGSGSAKNRIRLSKKTRIRSDFYRKYFLP